MRVVGLLVVAALAASPVLASFLLYVPTVEISGVQNCAELSGLQIDGHDLFPPKVDSKTFDLKATVSKVTLTGTFTVEKVENDVKGYTVTLGTHGDTKTTTVVSTTTASTVSITTTHTTTTVATSSTKEASATAMTTTPSSVRKRRRASSTPTITVLAQLQEVKVETVHSSNTAAVVIAVLEGLVILGVIGFAVYVVFFKNRTAKPSRFSNAIVPPPQPARPEELAPATRIGQAQPPPPEVPQRGWSRQPLQAVPPSGDPFNAWEMEETSTARSNLIPSSAFQ
ncbi:hypothetical protein QR680_013079 [Steinernema hermaphroditum]|uniref:Uncharacterized protein n=1 Tax=Steinernema hermaphroditum TaxID=289476 RepID=A0AA39M1W5_9BILA|nr:hypothetical protein QR680_013079 [Steinernema hermaphroditum]